MDPIIDKEIQNLIDNERGDHHRLLFIQKSLREEKKVYNTDQKYLMKLLNQYSKEENILDRLDYLNPKVSKKISKNIIDTGIKYCNNCKKMVKPIGPFNHGVWFWFLLLGIIGLIYYKIKGKRCPECKKKDWKSNIKI